MTVQPVMNVKTVNNIWTAATETAETDSVTASEFVCKVICFTISKFGVTYTNAAFWSSVILMCIPFI